jgi:hypothetical protein
LRTKEGKVKISMRAQRKGEFEEWPLNHLFITGGILLLLFLEGVFIVAGHGAWRIAILIALWIASFPVIHFSMCRKCNYYGKRCPIPGEGNLVHILFKKKEGPTGFLGWMGVVLCYVMRLGYPVIFLDKNSVWIGAIYATTFLVYMIILGRVLGCPNCVKVECPMNPDWGMTQ